MGAPLPGRGGQSPPLSSPCAPGPSARVSSLQTAGRGGPRALPVWAWEGQESRRLGWLLLRGLEPGHQETHHPATCGKTPEPGPQGEVSGDPCSPLPSSTLLCPQGTCLLPFLISTPDALCLLSLFSHKGWKVPKHYLKDGEQQRRNLRSTNFPDEKTKSQRLKAYLQSRGIPEF